MPKIAWATVCWPGLPQLMKGGSLLIATQIVGFSIFLNLCILATWVWPELLESGVLATAWVIMLGFWLVGGYFNVKFLQNLAYISSRDAAPDLFPLAQIEYLKGNWFETEALLTKLLDRNPWDIEAHLLFVALLRQTDNTAEALEHLDYIRTLNGSERWQLEIVRETQFLRLVNEQPPKLPAELPAFARELPVELKATVDSPPIAA